VLFQQLGELSNLFPFLVDCFQSEARLVFFVDWTFAQCALLFHLKLTYIAAIH
jgi:hypothetical protein